MTTIPMSATVAPKVRAKKVKVDSYELVVDGVPVSYPRVTSICGILAKPVLVNWQIRTTQDAAFKAASGLYESLSLSPAIPAAQFETMLRDRLAGERADEKILHAAGDIGTNVHKYIQWRLHTEMGQWGDVVEPTLLTPEARQAVDVWLQWWEKIEKEPLFIEQKVYNPEHQYAGTEDWKGHINGVLTDLDWKTSSGIYDEALLQNAAYAFARPYDGDAWQRAGQGMIVRLPKRKGDVADFNSPEWCRVITKQEQDGFFDLFCKARALYRWMEGR